MNLLFFLAWGISAFIFSSTRKRTGQLVFVASVTIMGITYIPGGTSPVLRNFALAGLSGFPLGTSVFGVVVLARRQLTQSGRQDKYKHSALDLSVYPIALVLLFIFVWSSIILVLAYLTLWKSSILLDISFLMMISTLGLFPFARKRRKKTNMTMPMTS